MVVGTHCKGRFHGHVNVHSSHERRHYRLVFGFMVGKYDMTALVHASPDPNMKLTVRYSQTDFSKNMPNASRVIE